MWTPRYLMLVVILPLFCRAQQSGPDSPTLTFRPQTRLVLLPFHAASGKNYRRDLQASDVVLLEDGVLRSFTVFDSPATEGRIPLDLVLLFDSNPAFEPLWDPAGVYRFAGHWENHLWDPIFNRQDADVRISIYHTFGQKLCRLSPTTTEPVPLTRSLNGLLRPILPGAGEDDGGIPLSLPPKRDRVGSGRFTWDFPTSPFIGQGATQERLLLGPPAPSLLTGKDQAARLTNAHLPFVIYSPSLCLLTGLSDITARWAHRKLNGGGVAKLAWFRDVPLAHLGALHHSTERTASPPPEVNDLSGASSSCGEGCPDGAARPFSVEELTSLGNLSHVQPIVRLGTRQGQLANA
jgi:hypothetical protein